MYMYMFLIMELNIVTSNAPYVYSTCVAMLCVFCLACTVSKT